MYLVVVLTSRSRGSDPRGHMFASWDFHKFCPSCREKKIGVDDCTVGLACSICERFTPEQKKLIASRHSYQKRQEAKKARSDTKAGSPVSVSKSKSKTGSVSVSVSGSKTVVPGSARLRPYSPSDTVSSGERASRKRNKSSRTKIHHHKYKALLS